jgi:outer membrane protein assembly factor BamA
MIAALVLTLALQAAAPERVAEIRVHGNATLSDEAVIALAGIAPGAMLDAAGIEAIEKKLRDSGRFDEVQVRKRYRTLAMDDVALVLLVHEKPGLTASGQPPGIGHRLRSKLMFFPILDYEDGYGWTYGARTSLVNIAGKGTHVIVPLSWGARKNADVTLDRTFESGPFTRATATFGVLQRENPYYRLDDRRTALSGRVERRLFDLLTVGGEVARADVVFGTGRDSLWTGGVDAAIDTRRDPAYPSDAVWATARWNRLHASGATSYGPDLQEPGVSDATIDRYSLDGRGYKRLFRQNVLAVRAHYDTASAPLPPYEQWLLGGSSVRALEAGTFAGDIRFFWAAEVRVPFTAPLDAGRIGLNVFTDGGVTAAYGERLGTHRQSRSAGAGFWLTIAIVHLNFDVAHSLDGRGTRFHFGTGFTF